MIFIDASFEGSRDHPSIFDEDLDAEIGGIAEDIPTPEKDATLTTPDSVPVIEVDEVLSTDIAFAIHSASSEAEAAGTNSTVKSARSEEKEDDHSKPTEKVVEE